jgi:hypothetical protein
MWLAFVFALVARFVPAFIEVAATCHLEAAPFALDGMQPADVLGDPPLLGFLLRFHGRNVTIGAGQPLSSIRLLAKWDRLPACRSSLYISIQKFRHPERRLPE